MPSVPARRIWSDDMRVLLDDPFDVMYAPHKDSVTNVNAMARLVIYWIAIAFAISKNYVVLVIGLLALFLLRGEVKAIQLPLDTVQATSTKFCQMPDVDNPMANSMPSDWGSGTAKLPACPSDLVEGSIRDAMNSQPITGPVMHAVGDDSSTLLAQRQFYSMPSTTVPSERRPFLNAIYGETGPDRSLKYESWYAP